MLKKNVYVLYPPGYSGSFINWAINISDQDLSEHTVKNPTNTSTSDMFGGRGTSHLHTRIPTHQDVQQHINWVLYNRPTEPRVYILNANNHIIYHSIFTIAQHDPNGVFINIHANNNDLVGSFGTINCVTKWPVYISALLALNPAVCQTPMHETFDVDQCSNDILFRNWMVRNNDSMFYHNRPLDHTRLQNRLQSHREWFRVRNNAHPHEVNESMYIADPDLTNRVFELSCLDICSSNFIDWFRDFMQQSNVSDSYTTNQVELIHPQYQQAQANLQWFESIAHWEATGVLDKYLLSHSGIQAQVLRIIFANSGKIFLTSTQQDRWTSFFARCRGPMWPESSFDEYDFFKFPQWLQDEIKNFGYQLNVTKPPIQEVIDLDWENMSLQEINAVYQSTKPRS